MKQKQETRITIRFPSELIERIKVLAQDEHRSINSEVVHAVEAYVQQHTARKKHDGHESV